MVSLILMRRFLHHRLILALLVSALAQAFAHADPWLEVRTPHFSLVTDAGERHGRALALQFEQMRAVFGRLLPRNRVNLPVPLRIVAFGNSGDFRRFVPAGPAGPGLAPGVVLSGEDRDFLLLDLSSQESLPAALHHFAHLLLAGNYPHTRPWFDEGFAEYFSTIRIEAREVRAGSPPASALGLQGAALLPVTELLAVAPGSKAYDEGGDRRSVFYAESWLLVRYLFENDKLTQIADYFDLVHNQHLPVAEALRRAFGMEPAQLDRILREAANPLRPSRRTFEGPAGEAADYRVVPLDEADTQALFADLHLQSPGSLDLAIREFQEVLTLSPHHAAAHRGLGCASLARQQLAQASEHFRQAARVAPDDPLVHYYFALLLNRRGQAAGGLIEDPWTMKREAEIAISLAPDFAAAYGLLAAAEASIGDMEAAIAGIKKAVRLSPRNDLYAADLAQYYLLAQKWDDAAALFEYLKDSDDPQIAAAAAADLKLLPALRRTPPSPVARREQSQDWSKYDDPKWRRRVPAPLPPESATPEDAAPTAPDSRPIKFLKGKLLQVECSQPPAALLTVLSGKKTWKLRVANSGSLVLVGAASFSCGWRNRDVAVNFREGGQADGDLVSLELD